MPKGKKQAPSRLSIRAYRSALAALKKAGLISKKIDARSHHPTRYMLGQLKTFRHILDGTAKTVKVPDAKTAKFYSELYPTKFDRVVIRTQHGERGRWDDDREALIITRKSGLPYGIKSTRQILEAREFGTLPRLPRDNSRFRYFYAVPFKRGNKIDRIYIDTLGELKRVMTEYARRPIRPFLNWQNYVEIIEGEIDPKSLAGNSDASTVKVRGKTSNASRKAKAQPRDAKGRFSKRE